MNQWDERYSKEDYHYGTEPNDFLRDHAASLLEHGKQPANILCLADGEGRNSVYLAKLGAHATALDISQVGLQKAQRLAQAEQVAITTEWADLSKTELPEQAYDGVVMIFCHLPRAHRPFLYEQIAKTLKPGGWFLAECYTPAQLGRGTGGPPSADLMLTAAEFYEAFQSFEVTHSQELVRSLHEGTGHTGAGAVCQFIAFKPA